jgi:hypothetical protein
MTADIDPTNSPVKPGTDLQSLAETVRHAPELSLSWRDHLKIHPAADIFPRLLDGELRELAEDIRRNGQRVPVAVFHSNVDSEELIDGRSRLDAMESAGMSIITDGALNRDVVLVEDVHGNVDPYAYVVSVNIHRRHLSAEKKRELIGALLKARPERSNRAIGKQIKADHKTVAHIRAEMESTAEIPQLEKTVGADNKSRSTSRKTNGANGTDQVVADKHGCGDERQGGEASDGDRDAQRDGDEQTPTSEAAVTPAAGTYGNSKSVSAPVLDLWREIAASERRGVLAAILEGLEVEELVEALPVHLRNGLEARLLRLRGLQRSTQLTKFLKTALRTRSPAEQITSLARMSEVLSKEGLTADDAHVRVSKHSESARGERVGV